MNYNFKDGLFYKECEEIGVRCITMHDNAGREYIFRADNKKQITVQIDGSSQVVIRVSDGKLMKLISGCLVIKK